MPATAEVEVLVAPEYAATGLDEDFAQMVQMRHRVSHEIKQRAITLADFDKAIMKRMGERPKVKVGNVTVTQVPSGVTRHLDRGKLLTKMDAGELAMCMTESPRAWYVKYSEDGARGV